MFLKPFVLGMFVKAITGFDDTLTRVPVIITFTKTRMGKIAFSIGSLIAMLLAIIIAFYFASFIKLLPHYRYVVAALIFALAIIIYFGIFVDKPRKKAEKKIVKMEKISAVRFTNLLGIGFIASFITVLDDVIAYSSVFLGNTAYKIYAAAGILVATIIEIFLVIYFAEKLNKIKHKEKFVSFGLALLGILVLFGII